MKKIIIYLSIFPLLIIFLYSCSNNGTNPITDKTKYYSIQVNVQDTDYVQTVANANIAIKRNDTTIFSKYTDLNGFAKIDSIPEGNYTISCNIGSYLPASQTLNLNEATNKNINFNISKGYLEITYKGQIKKYLYNDVSDFYCGFGVTMNIYGQPVYNGKVTFSTNDGWYGYFYQSGLSMGSSITIEGDIPGTDNNALNFGQIKSQTGSFYAYIGIASKVSGGNFTAMLTDSSSVSGKYNLRSRY